MTVVAEWNDWQPWACSVTCGGGDRVRFRTCVDPYPDDTDVCLGPNIEEDPFPCNNDLCPGNNTLSIIFTTASLNQLGFVNNQWEVYFLVLGLNQRSADCHVDVIPTDSYIVGR